LRISDCGLRIADFGLKDSPRMQIGNFGLWIERLIGWSLTKSTIPNPQSAIRNRKSEMKSDSCGEQRAGIPLVAAGRSGKIRQADSELGGFQDQRHSPAHLDL